jgi:predicted ArsR family transcriptional regulator
MVGRRPRVDDAEVLRLIVTLPDPVVTSSDLAGPLEMTQQGAYARLVSLEEDGYLRSKKVGGAARVFWPSRTGRELAASAEFGDGEDQ